MFSVTTNAGDDPWDTYTRHPLRQGWAYPIGQSTVRTVLDGAHVRVHYLDLSGGYAWVIDDARPNVIPGQTLITASWASDRRPGVRAYFDSDGKRTGWTSLSIYSVPSKMAQHARQLIVDEALNAAVTWLAGIGERGDAWQASMQEWTASTENGALKIWHT